MTIAAFVDTSALYALLDADDPAHTAARQAFVRLLEDGDALVTHNYVVLEAVALAQRRLGLGAVAGLHDRLLPVMETTWVDRDLHSEALAATLAASERWVSLVDRVSFAFMRRRGILRALAFDRDFGDQGFVLVR